MKIIYVAGKYRGASDSEVHDNIEHARRAAIKLWREGYAVITPHLNTAFFGGSCPDETWLKGDLEILKRCDAIYLLSGWGSSQGAREELKLADSLGLEVLFEEKL